MSPEQLTIQIVEAINIAAIIVFFILFIIRLCKIRKMSVTCKYFDDHWKIRFVIALLYIALSAAIIAILLVYQSSKNQQQLIKSVITSGSIGFLINSLILIMHIWVFSSQIKRQLPFTRLHQNFLIYLILISCARLAIALQAYITPTAPQHLTLQIVILCLSVSIVLVSVCMLVYWIKNKNVLPTFDDFRKVDINTITERIIPLPHDRNYNHTSINQGDNTYSESWNIIVPNVTVELGKVRILLQMYSDDDILKSLGQQQTKCEKVQKIKKPKKTQSQKQIYRSHKEQKNKQKSMKQSLIRQHLQIISDQIYTFKQIKQIYINCSRFDMETEIKFDVSVADFYRQVKKFMDELFSIRQAYVPEIFQMFRIQKHSILQLNTKIDKLVTSRDQLLISDYVDHNALFLSVEVFKQLWIDDHYVFYIHSKQMEQQKQSSVCYRRYTDFQTFHKKLQQILSQELPTPYKLPQLPKKHVFIWSTIDATKVTERRKQLELYCQLTFNDYTLMTKVPRARELILQFLSMRKTFQITPHIKKAIEFYDGVQIRKGSIYKALVENYFKFSAMAYLLGIYLKGLGSLSRYIRYIKLLNIVNPGIHVEQPNILQIYSTALEASLQIVNKTPLKIENLLIKCVNNEIINKFFNMCHRFDMDNSGLGMSIIKRQPSDMEENGSFRDTADFNNHMGDISQASEKQRMSLLIEELGDNQI